MDQVFVNISVSTANLVHSPVDMTLIWSIYEFRAFSSSIIQDLVKVHKSLMVELQESILDKNALNLYQIFITYKDR